MAKFLKAKVTFTLAESEYGNEHEDTTLHTFGINFQAIAFLHGSGKYPVETLFTELSNLTNPELNSDIHAVLHEEYDELSKELKT